MEANTKRTTAIWLVVLVLLILLVDQTIKFWVKTTFALHEGIDVCGWFQIFFVENKGMAFGWELGSKLFLSLFRILACGVLLYYLCVLIKKNYSRGYVLTVGSVFAGALGNLIDCIFYGKIFSHSYGQVATLFPEEGGYGMWLQGRVVDMFYFPLITNDAGEVLFFSPVFTFADSAVTIGVFLILIFFRKELNASLDSDKKTGKQ